MPGFDLSSWQESNEKPLESQKLTACKDCLHFRNIGEWPHEKQCVASPLSHFNPIKGEVDVYGFDSVYRVNTSGACPKYAEKPKGQE
jgi:hypothetical protein